MQNTFDHVRFDGAGVRLAGQRGGITAKLAPCRHLRNYSQSLAWGPQADRSAALQCALAVLAAAAGDDAAVALHERFAVDVVLQIPSDGLLLPLEFVRRWVANELGRGLAEAA